MVIVQKTYKVKERAQLYLQRDLVNVTRPDKWSQNSMLHICLLHYRIFIVIVLTLTISLNDIKVFQLPSGLVGILNGWEEIGLQMVRISNGIWNLEAQPFEILANGSQLVKNHMKSHQKCQDFEWSGRD